MNISHALSPLHWRMFFPAALVLVIMLFPVAVVVGTALGSSAVFQFPPADLSLRWFTVFLSSSSFINSLFGVSLPLSLGVAAAATAIGTLAAIGIVRPEFPAKRLVETFFAFPVIFPQILLAVGLFLIYAQLGVPLGMLSLGVAHLVISTPYVIRTVVSGLSGVDVRLEEAAANLGAGPIKAFVLVTLPLLRSSIVSGAMFAFIVSFSDVNLALFLSAADASPLTLEILSQMQFDSNPAIAAGATIQVLVVSLLLMIIQRLIGTLRI